MNQVFKYTNEKFDIDTYNYLMKGGQVGDLTHCS